ncbi:MAG: tyrosine--tRNA ligase [Candidatus Moranbacteria bacterium]|nr:tyrosine--tRNA ligase [Candidatus Moranbacteria bacterium]
MTDEKLIEKTLERGVEEVIVKKNLKKRMLNGEKLRIKLGIDPTGSVLHLGHAVVLKKLRDFQELGHQVVFLIGDFTAKIGDPTGRASARKPMTDEEIKSNMEDYKRQAGLILDLSKVEIRYNSEWLSKMDFKDLVELTSKITYSQMAQRSDFKERIKKDVDLSIQEFLYPAMQGYDSVALEADVELGGTDQKFNLLMGRQIQKRYGQSSQDVVTCPLLEGLYGTAKMSKSEDNYISLTESAESMYGKTMSITDELIIRYFKLCTDVPAEEITQLEADLKEENINPRDAKMKLALEITKLYKGERKAEKAQEDFVNKFQKKGEDIEASEIKEKQGRDAVDVLADNDLAQSKSDARRKIEQGGVSVDGKKITLEDKVSKDWDGKILKVGKKEFRKLRVES